MPNHDADFEQDPYDFLDYARDWGTKEFAAIDGGDAIETSEWVIPDGLTRGEDEFADTHTSSVAIVWLGGGTAGENYRVSNRIITSAGRKFERTFVLKVREQ